MFDVTVCTIFKASATNLWKISTHKIVSISIGQLVVWKIMQTVSMNILCTRFPFHYYLTNKYTWWSTYMHYQRAAAYLEKNSLL